MKHPFQNFNIPKPNRSQLLTVAFGLFLYLAGYLTPDIRQPMQLAERPTSVVPTATPKARGTATPIPATATPFAPTLTPTGIVVTSTPLPEVTSTPFAHDVTLWHEPGVAGHQHGQNPFEAHPEIVAWLTSHPWGPLFSSIGHPWASSPVENLYPWPLGKHEGHINLSENDTHCDQFDPGGKFNHGNCITAYLFQVHALGNAFEFRARKHSDKIVAWVCDKATGLQCGIVATGGLADYGERAASYKKTLCPLPDNPLYLGNDSLNQPPYVTVNGSKRYFVFWSNLLNVSMEKYFNPVPNRLFQAAWNQRPFSVPSLTDCTDPSLDIQHTNLENRNNTFQVFTLLLYIEDFPRPFEGYTDIHGNLSTTCTAPSAVCVPLYIGANVPAGNATLNRPVDMGNPEAAPIQVYGADVELLPPGTMP